MAAGVHTLGVISDTHGLVRPEALAALKGVERIVHAGVAQRVGDHLGPAVVAVEPGLGDEDFHGRASACTVLM